MTRKRCVILCCSVLLAILLGLQPVAANRPLDVYYHVPTTEKVVALTFDDGPHPRFTDEILEILRKEEVRATFFAIGCNVASYPDVMRRVIAAGHEVGNHTYSHPCVRRVTEEQLVEEIEKTDAVLRSLGYSGNGLFRPPQGICSADMPTLLTHTKKTAILWNIDTRDWAHRASEEIVKEIDSTVCGGDIILFHDYVSGENTTIPAIKKLIPMLKTRGYQFVTVSELLSLKNG